MQNENDEKTFLSMSVDSGIKYMARNQSSNIEYENNNLQHEPLVDKVDAVNDQKSISYTMAPIQRQTDSAKNIKEFVPGNFIPKQHTESDDQSVQQEQMGQSINTVAWSTTSTVTD